MDGSRLKLFLKVSASFLLLLSSNNMLSQEMLIASDSLTTPYNGSHEIRLTGTPQLYVADTTSTLVKGGFAGELDEGSISNSDKNLFNLDPIDFSGGTSLDWTYDLSKVGIDLSPIGGPDWDLGSWGVRPVANAWTGVDIGMATSFLDTADNAAMNFNVDVPIEITYDIPPYEKGEPLVIRAQSIIPAAEDNSDYLNFANGDYSKELITNFGVGTEVGLDIVLGPFGTLEPRILDYDFRASDLWGDDGVTLVKANKFGFSGELGLVGRPVFNSINNEYINIGNQSYNAANNAISSMNSAIGNFNGEASWDLDGEKGFGDILMGSAMGLSGSSFDIPQMIINEVGGSAGADLDALYCIYKIFHSPVTFDLPDFSAIFNFDSIGIQIDSISGFDNPYQALVINDDVGKAFVHPGHIGDWDIGESAAGIQEDTPSWYTDWMWYGSANNNVAARASFYAYTDEEEPIIYYSNICMANNDEGGDFEEETEAVNDTTEHCVSDLNDLTACPCDTTGTLCDDCQVFCDFEAYLIDVEELATEMGEGYAEDAIREQLSAYGMPDCDLKDAIVDTVLVTAKATSAVLYKKIGQYGRMPVGRSRKSNINAVAQKLRNKVPKSYEKVVKGYSNGKKVYQKGQKAKSVYNRYKKKASKIPAWAIVCEPTFNNLDLVGTLFDGNPLASAGLAGMDAVLSPIGFLEKSTDQWFTTAPQLDLFDMAGISFTLRQPSSQMTDDAGMFETTTGYRFKSETEESSDWVEIRHNFFDTFEYAAEMYCPVLMPTPPCAALVALEMRKSEDNGLLEEYLPEGTYESETGKITIWAFAAGSLLGPAESLLEMLQKTNDVLECAHGSGGNIQSNLGGAVNAAMSINNSLINFANWGMTAVTNLEMLNIWMRYNLIDAENKFSVSNEFDAEFNVDYEYQFKWSASATTNPEDSADTSLPDLLKNPVLEEESEWFTADQLRDGVDFEIETNCADATHVNLYARIASTTGASVKGADVIADSILYELYNFETGINKVNLIPSFGFKFPCTGSVEKFAKSLGSCAAAVVVKIWNKACKIFGGKKCKKKSKCKTCTYGFPGLNIPEWSIGVGHDDEVNLATESHKYLDVTLDRESLDASMVVSHTRPNGEGQDTTLVQTDITEAFLVDSLTILANTFAMQAVDVYRSPGFDEAEPSDSTVIAKFVIASDQEQLTGTFRDFQVPEGSNFLAGTTALEKSEDSGFFVGKLPSSIYGDWGVKSPSGCNATIVEVLPVVAMPLAYSGECVTLPGEDDKWPDGSTGCFCADDDRDMCNDCGRDATGNNVADVSNDGQQIFDPLTDELISDGDYDGDGACDFGDDDDDNDGSLDIYDPEDFNQFIVGDIDGDGQEDGWCRDYTNVEDQDLSGCANPDTLSNEQYSSTSNIQCLVIGGVPYVRCSTLDYDNDAICDYNDRDADGDGVLRSPNTDVFNADFEAFDLDSTETCNLYDIADTIWKDSTQTAISFIQYYDCNDLNPTSCFDLDEDFCDDCTNGSSNSFNDGPDFDRDGICDSFDYDDDNDGVADTLEPTYFGVLMDKNPMFCGLYESDSTEADYTAIEYEVPCDSCVQNWIEYATGYLDNHLLVAYSTSSEDSISNIRKATLEIWDGFTEENSFTSQALQNLTSAIEQVYLIDSGGDSTAIDDLKMTGDSLINLIETFGNQGTYDFDGDGICDSQDTDWDNDGIENQYDSNPYNPYECADSDFDGCDDCAIGVDGFGPLNDALPDADGQDTDGDGLCDNWDFNGDTIAYHLDLDIDDDGRMDGRLGGILDSLLLRQAQVLNSNTNLLADHPFEFYQGATDDSSAIVTYNLANLANDSLLFGPQLNSAWSEYSAAIPDPFIYDNLFCGDLDFDECDDCISGYLSRWSDGPNLDVLYAMESCDDCSDEEQIISLGGDSLNDYYWQLYSTRTDNGVLPLDTNNLILAVKWSELDTVWENDANRVPYFSITNGDSVSINLGANQNALWLPSLKAVNPVDTLENNLMIDSLITFNWNGETWHDETITLPANYYEIYSHGDTLTSADTLEWMANSSSAERTRLFNDSVNWILSLDSLALQQVYGDIDADGDGVLQTFAYSYNAFQKVIDGTLVGHPIIQSHIMQDNEIVSVEVDTSNSKIAKVTDADLFAIGFHELVLRDSLFHFGAKFQNEILPDQFENSDYSAALAPADSIILDNSSSDCELFAVVNEYYKRAVAGGRFVYFDAFMCVSETNDYAREIISLTSDDSARFVIAQNFSEDLSAFTSPSQCSNPYECSDCECWVGATSAYGDESSALFQVQLNGDSAAFIGFEYSNDVFNGEPDSNSSTEVKSDLWPSLETLTSYNMFQLEVDSLNPNSEYYVRAFATTDSLDDGSNRHYGQTQQFHTYSASLDMEYRANDGLSQNSIYFEEDPEYPTFRKVLRDDQINSFDYITKKDTALFDLDDFDNRRCLEANGDGVDDCSHHSYSYKKYNQEAYGVDENTDFECVGWYQPTFFKDFDGDGIGTDTSAYSGCVPEAENGWTWVPFKGDNCDDSNACNFDSINNADCQYAEDGYDCDGNCLVDTNNDGICD